MGAGLSGCGYETLEVGYPRNDRLATATAEDVAAVRAQLGIAPGTSRSCSTRPRTASGCRPGTPVLDVEELAERLGPDTVLLVRAHYFYVPTGRAGVSPARPGASTCRRTRWSRTSTWPRT